MHRSSAMRSSRHGDECNSQEHSGPSMPSAQDDHGGRNSQLRDGGVRTRTCRGAGLGHVVMKVTSDGHATMRHLRLRRDRHWLSVVATAHMDVRSHGARTSLTSRRQARRSSPRRILTHCRALRAARSCSAPDTVGTRKSSRLHSTSTAASCRSSGATTGCTSCAPPRAISLCRSCVTIASSSRSER